MIPCRRIIDASDTRIDSQPPEWSGPRHDRLPYSQAVVFTVLKRKMLKDLNAWASGFEDDERLNCPSIWEPARI